jgi:hypothetical protein
MAVMCNGDVRVAVRPTVAVLIFLQRSEYVNATIAGEQRYERVRLYTRRLGVGASVGPGSGCGFGADVAALSDSAMVFRSKNTPRFKGHLVRSDRFFERRPLVSLG